MKKAALVAVLLAGAFLILSMENFSSWGDIESPASRHISRYFIEKSYEDTHTPNFVTAVLADYRGFDTMLETVVVFTAALACFLIVRLPSDVCKPGLFYYRHASTGLVVRRRQACALPDEGGAFERVDSDWPPHDVVVTTTCRMIIPFIQLYALYVLAHGHYSPGGGFQGGVIFAASYVLLAVSHDLRTLVNQLTERFTHLLAAAGVLVYFGTGLLGLAKGANFLDYDAVADIMGVSLASGHSLGILFVETGVAMTVTAALVIIFKLLSSRGAVTEGL
ncbi:MAG: sodium:proton antiporter [Pseudodesulfovibrio sp.]|uniref:Na+/H+ antiporter MnhB subunit-related protein n=1 Tax=Pseudodesulfovibrio aespoeensis (strain ATCC 700646 / DSM 10631 / Aspo-2) TaxID=643562 RepID=E6VT50_PSEA9|nr:MULTISPECIES: hydrogen gas-evolving membrane-bound hydrogenase subunit E [Pseudodesulfovibrio]MBU4378015.1 sodium:proton antiporter [Pseudomonadota bacterium]ADU62100.1 Na+/H+ antiporter MnhB subunit-related protein [Pseudodesulfovibrio aespoeensis Aspo-2]MBU4475003.1 sodium:proton antiporter [Pseudomonadota bacterium]MBU4515929.1 sodium:proton antiporter [Pseudomonadota bacterium]MBU4522869.1 sodium:proton antiporter [Pseudomonadota bacterium]